MNIDQVEKTARIVLWLAIASACVIVPISYISLKRAESKVETELQEAVKKAEAKVADLEKEKETKSRRLALASMGTYLSGLNYQTAQGNLWFTNVSARSGTLCVVGEAEDAEPNAKVTTSIPACQEVAPYAAVHVELMFAGGDLAAACPKSNCRMTFKEAPQSKD